MTGRVRKLIAAGAVVLATLVAGAGIAVAANEHAVASGVNDSTIFKFGRTVDVSGTVNGDIFCAATTVTIDATVNGDVICAGQTVTVNGHVHGDVRLAGQTVTVGAQVDGNASVAGTDVTLQSNGRVGNDVSVTANTAELDGDVGRDVHAGGHTLILNGHIGRNVTTNVSKLELQSAAVVNGNIDYTSPNNLQNNGGKVVGKVTYHQAQEHHTNWAWWHGFALALRLYWGFALLVTAIILAAIFPQMFVRWNKIAWARPWAALLTGFVAMFVFPALLFVLFLSILGAPLALLVLLAWFALLLLTAPVAAFYVGSLVFRQHKHSPVLIMLVGSAVLLLVTLIPILGGLVTIFAYWFALGVLLLNSRTWFKKPDYRAV